MNECVGGWGGCKESMSTRMSVLLVEYVCGKRTNECMRGCYMAVLRVSE